jgi:hypothetical protein
MTVYNASKSGNVLARFRIGSYLRNIFTLVPRMAKL